MAGAPNNVWLGATRRLRIAVGIATIGRPSIVAEAIAELAKQSRLPDRIIVCAPSAHDLKDLDPTDGRIDLLLGPRGLTCQRNAILHRARDFDVLIFFDDDFVASPRFVEVMECAFATNPDVVLGTGMVLADGIGGAGLSFAAARALLRDDVKEAGAISLSCVYSAYGCNMAVRLAPALANAIEFDERLPLYGWYEDVDFSRRLARHGRIVQVSHAIGVHLGIKLGRESGRRLGYSQIANPLYLLRKGTCSRQKAWLQITKNLAMNLGRALLPEAYVDRLGRARGNGLAMFDLLAGRLDPSRILSL
jgi:GT2 family glycosyltransferase